MPSLTGKQHRYMGHCKSDPSDKGCPPAKVVNEFLSADRGRHFERGGYVPQNLPAFMRRRYG